MPCNVSGTVALYLAGGTLDPTAYEDAVVYLQPTRTDFQVLVGSDWVAWEGDPDLETTYPGAISATVNGSGNFTFAVPYTDTECALPTSSASPELEWQIIDPNPQSGVIYYRGKTEFAVVGASKTIKELITLASPDDWVVSGTAYNGYPTGTERFSTAAFTSSSTATTVSFPSIGTASWKHAIGVETNDPTGVYKVTIDLSTKTDIGASITVDPPVPLGYTVYAYVRAYT